MRMAANAECRDNRKTSEISAIEKRETNEDFFSNIFANSSN